MSWMATPPSSSASIAASAPRSIRSLSVYRPKRVIDAPRIQTLSPLSLMRILSAGLEAERHRFGSVVVGAGDEGGELDGHTERDVLGLGLDVDDVGLHDSAALEIDDRGDVRRGHAGGRTVHDREAADRPLAGEGLALELALTALGARVATVEVQRAAFLAGVRHQVGLRAVE